MNPTDYSSFERDAVAYLKNALPLADRIALSPKQLRAVAAQCWEASHARPWFAAIPEDVFMPFVLFPRVNNEDFTFYVPQIGALLWPRLTPEMGMEAAVMAVNRWCFEQATYQSTDGRTACALTVMRRGFGRCGEESVLLVSALRACGIPARQVYVPLWSHCDDNHAWVEAWVDGTWRYLGACEPELALDSGWFTAAASKAMLVHTRAYGMLPASERAENHIGSAWIINRTAAYARTRLLTVRVTENGAPKPGLRVRFELANMAAWMPICEKETDANGAADLLTGLGTLRVWITDGTRGLGRVVDVAERADWALDFADAAPAEPDAWSFEQRPPRESKIQPADFPRDMADAHERWLADTERARNARFTLPEDADPLLRAARGNRAVIEAFLSDEQFAEADRRALLESLREKDLADIDEETLADALTRALPCKGRYPEEVWRESVLCPRVKNEMLRPVRRWMQKRLPRFSDAEEVWQYLRRRMEPCEMDPPTLTPDLRATLEYGKCSPAVLDVLFVAVCRANGLAARLDPLTGEKMFWSEGAYRALLPAREPDAKLLLKNGAAKPLTAGVHYSISVLENGAYRPLDLHGAALDGEVALPLFPGAYRVMTVSRQIDGSLYGLCQCFVLSAGEERTLTLTLPEDYTAEKLVRAALPPLRAMDGDAAVELPGAVAGQSAIVALIAPGQEPTEHFLNELLEARDALETRRVAVRLLVNDAAQAENEKLRRVLATLEDARCLAAPDAAALLEWRRIMNAGELRLPLAVAVGRDGRGLFAFVNYNVGSVTSLIGIIDAQ